MTTMTMVEVGNRGVRESDLDLEKCFTTFFSTETRRLCTGVSHVQGLTRSVAKQGGRWMRVEISDS